MNEVTVKGTAFSRDSLYIYKQGKVRGILSHLNLNLTYIKIQISFIFITHNLPFINVC